MQYMETIAVIKISSDVIKCPTIGAASFSQSLYFEYLKTRKEKKGVKSDGAEGNDQSKNVERQFS